MQNETLKYNIGITLIHGIGDVFAKRLIAYCGSAEAVFKEKKNKLLKIPGVGETVVKAIAEQNIIERAEAEISFIEKYKVQPLFYPDENYPKRLKHCDDAPVMLYYMGNANLNERKVLSIVGTRRASNYGKYLCEKIIEELASQNILIVSGLAHGIDICAHRAALKNNMNTIGALGHGLDKLYPAEHSSTAKKMITKGGLLTEFISHTKMVPEFFPRRNRIVAGMADATLVVESAEKGGSLITAGIANSYNRDVFAVPGKAGDKTTGGCNWLIKTNRAMLVENAQDIIQALGWEEKVQKKKAMQKELFVELDENEKLLMTLLGKKEKTDIDNLSLDANLPMSQVSALLLNLEFKGLVKSLPGKMYEVA